MHNRWCSLRRALSEGRLLLGPFCKLATPQNMEIFGYAGFDFVILDCEHGPLSAETVENLVRAAKVTGLHALVRVPHNEPASIDRILDVGAAGIIVPRISTAEEARKLACAARYAPDGERGLCRYVRAAKYSKMDRYQYLKEANRDVLVIAMIESAEGFGNLPGILATKGIDAIFVGPYDLSQSLGIPGQVDAPEVEHMMTTIVSQAHRAGVATATFVESPEGAKKWADVGVQMISYSTDVGIMLQASIGIVRSVRRMLMDKGSVARI